MMKNVEISMKTTSGGTMEHTILAELENKILNNFDGFSSTGITDWPCKGVAITKNYGNCTFAITISQPTSNVIHYEIWMTPLRAQILSGNLTINNCEEESNRLIKSILTMKNDFEDPREDLTSILNNLSTISNNKLIYT